MASKVDQGKTNLGQAKAEALKRWETISAASIAGVLFTQVKGNTAKLQTPPSHPNSIWGRIVKDLKLPNTKIDRLWACAAYEGNATVKDILRTICDNAGNQCHDQHQSNIPKENYCFCRKLEKENGDPNYPMVECDRCGEWYHGVCLGIEVSYYNDKSFTCPTCLGTPETEIAPALFRPVPRKGPPILTPHPQRNVPGVSSLESQIRQADFPPELSPAFSTITRRSVITGSGGGFGVTARRTRNNSATSDGDAADPVDWQRQPKGHSPLTRSRVEDNDTSPTRRSVFERTQQRESTGLGEWPLSENPQLSSGSLYDFHPLLQSPRRTYTKSANASPESNTWGDGGDDGFQENQDNSFLQSPSQIYRPLSRGAISEDIIQSSPGRTYTVSDESGRSSVQGIRHIAQNQNMGASSLFAPRPLSRSRVVDEAPVQLSPQRTYTISPQGSVTSQGDVPEYGPNLLSAEMESDSQEATTKAPVTYKKFHFKAKLRGRGLGTGTRTPLEHGDIIYQPRPVSPDNAGDEFLANAAEMLEAEHYPEEGRRGQVESHEPRHGDNVISDEDENNALEGPMEGFDPFTVKIAKDDYKLIQNRVYNPQARDKRFAWQYPKGKWSHIFATSFLRDCPLHMKGCRLTFHDHRFPSETSAGGVDFCTTSAKCSRKGSVVCSMKYNFSITNKPIHNQDVLVNVIPSGVLHHDLSVTDKRRLAGLRREEAKERLRETGASVYRREKYGDPNTERAALERGNLTEVQTVNVLRVARHEDREKDDFDKDILQDLIKRAEFMRTLDHLGGKCISGFVQELSIYPFYVSLYTERQMKLLRQYLAFNPQGVIHIDSTGSVTAKLPLWLGEKQSYYYAVVIQLPGSEESPCVPICEFITNQHFSANIAHILHYFFRKYGENFGKDQKAFGIRRVETDCSRSLIAAILQALEIGRVDRYLKDAWQCIQAQTPIYFVHHICRSHSTKFIGEAIKSHYREAERPSLMTWRNKFLFSKTLQDFCRRVRDVSIICGKQFYTTDVKETLAKLSDPTPERGFRFLSSDHLRDLPDYGPFYAISPFSNYAIRLCHQLKITGLRTMYKAVGEAAVHDLDDDDAAESNHEKNPFFCIEFLKYLIKQVFSMGCLFNHSLLHLNGYTTSVDTNATSEAWNKILKRDEMTRGLGLKIGRFVAFSEDILKGRLEMFELGLGRMQRRHGGRQDRALSSQEDLTADSDEDSRATPEASMEVWKSKRSHQVTRAKPPSSLLGVILLQKGLTVETVDGDLDVSNLINIDSCMQILYSFFKLRANVHAYILQSSSMETEHVAKYLVEAFAKIDAHEFMDCKKIVIETVMRINFEYIGEDDFLLSEIRFIRSIADIFPVYEISDCKKNCPMASSHKIFPYRDFMIRSYHSIPLLLKRHQYKDKCEICQKEKVTVEYRWSNLGALPLVVYPVDIRTANIVVENLPHSVGIIGSRYSLLAFTYYFSTNFFAVIYQGNKRFRYDGSRIVETNAHPPAGHKISSVWYAPSSS